VKVATWNVNGVRAREADVLAWIERERPDVLCLQELKATLDQIPPTLCALTDYWCHWHGNKGYSGVGLLVHKQRAPEQPEIVHPAFDHESRIVTARLGDLTLASIYVPNGGKDYEAKLRFLEAMQAYAAAFAARGAPLLLCGDFNVARTGRDVHPKERKPNLVGQRPEERALIEGILSHGLVDVGRALDPDNDQLFTWWAPWRNLRQRNIGWRLDYMFASAALAATAVSCVSHREVGTSDHAPVVATFATVLPEVGADEAADQDGHGRGDDRQSQHTQRRARGAGPGEEAERRAHAGEHDARDGGTGDHRPRPVHPDEGQEREGGPGGERREARARGAEG
jgi:exodeoxyribonuclease-3